jgi:hypothetical protein
MLCSRREVACHQKRCCVRKEKWQHVTKRDIMFAKRGGSMPRRADFTVGTPKYGNRVRWGTDSKCKSFCSREASSDSAGSPPRVTHSTGREPEPPAVGNHRDDGQSQERRSYTHAERAHPLYIGISEQTRPRQDLLQLSRMETGHALYRLQPATTNRPLTHSASRSAATNHVGADIVNCIRFQFRPQPHGD